MADSNFDRDLLSYQAPNDESYAEPLKTCWMCKQTKPVSSFGNDASRSDGLNPRCKACSAAVHAQKQAAKGLPEAQVCKICRIEKPTSSFGVAETKKRVPWLRKTCLECEAGAADRKRQGRKPFARSPNAAENNKRYRTNLKLRDGVEAWPEKRCVSCKETKPADQFHKNKSEVSGLATRCKACKALQHEQTYAKRAAAYSPVAEANCLGCKLTKPASEFYKQTAAASGLFSYCIVCSKERAAQGYAENREERVRSSWIWQKQNPERNRAIRISSRCNKRAKQAGAAGLFSPQEWVDLLIAHEHKCFYCGKAQTVDVNLTADHKLSLCRGGSGWITNIAPACLSCNATKKDKTPEEYALWREKNADVLGM